MSRVERIDDPTDRRGSEQRRQAQRAPANRRADAPGRTPGKAEGEEGDVEEALRHQQE
jgi:hypothetical protein